MSLIILFVDEFLLVVDKPSGLLSVPGRGVDKQDSLVSRLRSDFGEVLVAHRLDRDTSGVIIFARDGATLKALGRQFQFRQVDKIYVALVEGRVELDTGRIALPLAKDFAHPPRHCVDYVFGRTAVTDYRVLDRGAASTRLELRPLTGRSHQLRVHLSEQGHLVVGDKLYGPDAPRQPDERLCLHACSISLRHPVDHRPLCFESSVPF